MDKFDNPLVKKLLNQSPFSFNELKILISTAPQRYKNHYIEKRNGRGRRLISQPTKELKNLQRSLLSIISEVITPSAAAIAYSKGKSIKDHAAPHAKNSYLLKLDFKDFFPSIDWFTISYCFKKTGAFSEDEIKIINHILCRYDKRSTSLRGAFKLSIGAPSSPPISNFIMKEFDEILEEFCKNENIVYTRYADDLALSCSEPKKLDEVKTFIETVLSEKKYLNLSLNEEKTVNVSKKNKRTLVGVILSNDGCVSVGRDKKREIRATLHNASQGLLTSKQLNTLKGRLSYYINIDSDFVYDLIGKYNFTQPNEISFPTVQEPEAPYTQYNLFFDNDDDVPF